jgi:hypothetical protein
MKPAMWTIESLTGECKSWFKRNEAILRQEYAWYARRADYDYNGPMPLAEWVRREFETHNEALAWDRWREQLERKAGA